MKKAIKKKSGQAVQTKRVEEHGKRHVITAAEKKSVKNKLEEEILKTPIEEEKTEEVVLEEPIEEEKPEEQGGNLDEVLKRMVQMQAALEKEQAETEEDQKTLAINLEAEVDSEDTKEEKEDDYAEEDGEDEGEEEYSEEEDEEDEEVPYTEGKTSKRKSSLVGTVVRKLVFCVSLGVFTYAVAGLLILMSGYWSSRREYENLIDNAIVMGTIADSNNVGGNNPSQSAAEGDGLNINIIGQGQASNQNSLPILQIDVNVELLKAINEDYVLWISIPGTNINYPVVQGETNNYYLRYTFQNKENMAGAIYLHSQTPKENRLLGVFNTIIMGHNRKDDTMFSQLVRFQDEEFGKENRYIYLILDGVEYIYEIFAFYELETYSIAYNPAADPTAYLQHIKGHNTYTNDIEVTEEDNIITLYTCNDDSSMRFLCHAILRGTCDMPSGERG